MSIHAIRFVPPKRHGGVPLKLYAEALMRMSEALGSIRHSVARRLAVQLDISAGEADRMFTLNVADILPGSVVVPVPIGDQGSLRLYGDPNDLFWAHAEPLITAASDGGDSLLTITAAEALADAGDLALKEGFGLGLASMQGKPRSRRKSWRQTVPLEHRGAALRQYAEHRRTVHGTNTVQLIGEVVEISARPQFFRLDTASLGRVQVAASADLMAKVTPLFGQVAVVVVEGVIDSDARIRDVKGVDAVPIKVGRSSVKDWEASKGTFGGAELWGSTDAEDYLRSLRGKSS